MTPTTTTNGREPGTNGKRLTPVNQQLINERMSTLALSERRLTSQTGIGHPSFRMARLEGVIPDHTTLNHLNKLARELGVTTIDLLTAEPPTHTSDSRPVEASATDDATLLIPHLITIPRLLSLTYIARVLDWPQPRVDAAITAIEQALTGTGLTLHNTRNEIRIVPATQRDTTIRQRLATTQTKPGGLDKGTARTLKRIHDRTHTNHRNIGNTERVNLGTLKNLGCIHIGEGGQWTLTPHLKQALLTED